MYVQEKVYKYLPKSILIRLNLSYNNLREMIIIFNFQEMVLYPNKLKGLKVYLCVVIVYNEYYKYKFKDECKVLFAKLKIIDF